MFFLHLRPCQLRLEDATAEAEATDREGTWAEKLNTAVKSAEPWNKLLEDYPAVGEEGTGMSLSGFVIALFPLKGEFASSWRIQQFASRVDVRMQLVSVADIMVCGWC